MKLTFVEGVDVIVIVVADNDDDAIAPSSPNRHRYNLK
jgi:hypothetical protein